MNRGTLWNKMDWTFRLLVILVAIASGTASSNAQESGKPIRALLVIGGCCHDYANQKEILTKGISARANVSWTIAYDSDKGTKHLNPIYENPDWAKDFDVIVHDECCSDVTDVHVIDRILEPHRNGLPAVILHCGMHSYRSQGYPDEVTPWFEFTGLKTTGHGAQLPISIAIADAEHPIMKGQSNWITINEELYNNFSGQLLETGHVLVRGAQTNKAENGQATVDDCVVVWTNTYKAKTRVFATTLGHNNDTVADPRYLDLVTRGLLWSVNKLDDENLKSTTKVDTGSVPNEPIPLQPELSAELIAMGDEDQKFRTIMQEAMVKASSAPGSEQPKELPKMIEKQAEIDHQNLARLEEIIQLHGWPGKSLVGTKGSIAAFLILQHSEQATQEKYLALFKEAANKGEARKSDAAMLEDRVLMRQGKKQIYGTQLQSNAESNGKFFLFPVEDELHVDQRRTSVGLPPLKEYLKNFGLEYIPPAK